MRIYHATEIESTGAIQYKMYKGVKLIPDVTSDNRKYYNIVGYTLLKEVSESKDYSIDVVHVEDQIFKVEGAYSKYAKSLNKAIGYIPVSSHDYIAVCEHKYSFYVVPTMLLIIALLLVASTVLEMLGIFPAYQIVHLSAYVVYICTFVYWYRL